MAKRDEAKFLKWAEEFGSRLPENLRNSWKAVVDNEYEGKDQLFNNFLMQDDYTKKTQELANRERELTSAVEEANRKVSAYDSWYQTEAPKVDAANKELQRLASLEAALQNTGFNVNNPNNQGQNQNLNQNQPTAQQDALLKEIAGLKDYVARIDRGAVAASVDLPNLAFRAAKEGYNYDSRKIVEISTRNNVPLEAAFEEFIKPEREARQKVEYQKALDNAREEGRKEAFSKVTPDSSAGVASTPVLDRLFSAQQQKDASGNPISVPTNGGTAALINKAIAGYYAAEGEASPFGN